MLRSALFLAVSAFSALISAQNYSTSGALSVDLSQIEPSLLQSWCRAQTASCPSICGGQAFPNTCDPSTLAWTCTCTDGAQPNISAYDATIPSFVCAQWRINCVANHPMDLPGQTACLSVVCGDMNPSSNVNTTTSSSSSSGMATSTPTTTGGSTPASSSSGAPMATTGAAAALHVAQHYGSGIIATGLLALFGFAL